MAELTFSVGEVGKIFGKSEAWVRWVESEGFIRDPETTKVVLPPRSLTSGNRTYNLPYLKLMVKSLRKFKKIPVSEANRVNLILLKYEEGLKTSSTR